jgi:hypothetical protein
MLRACRRFEVAFNIPTGRLLRNQYAGLFHSGSYFQVALLDILFMSGLNPENRNLREEFSNTAAIFQSQPGFTREEASALDLIWSLQRNFGIHTLFQGVQQWPLWISMLVFVSKARENKLGQQNHLYKMVKYWRLVFP